MVFREFLQTTIRNWYVTLEAIYYATEAGLKLCLHVCKINRLYQTMATIILKGHTCTLPLLAFTCLYINFAVCSFSFTRMIFYMEVVKEE